MKRNKIFLLFVTFLCGIFIFDPIKARAESKQIYINEICAKNTTVSSDDGGYYDWIELFNAGDEDEDISGIGISDDEAKPYKYVVPDNTVISAGNFLVIWCDKKASSNDNSIAPFGLSTEAETIILTAPINENSYVIDRLSYTDLDSDVSYGRLADDENILMYFDEMTPFEANTLEKALVVVPTFSHEAGFYEEEFGLTLRAADGCDIYYTLDGSTPTIESTKYVDPIIITDASSNENKFSAHTNISTSTCIAPDDLVDKATIIRAVAVNAAGKVSDIAVNTYFVGTHNKEKYSDLKVISLVTDEKNLFSDDKGIYVLGDTYNDWVNSAEYDSSYAWYYQPANYINKGKEWERPASIQVFYPDGYNLSQDIGIRIHGGASRAYLQKSFSLYARSEYGKSKMEYDFYQGDNVSEYNNLVINKYDSIMLRNAGNDYPNTRFRDKLNQYLVSDRNVATQEMAPCIVFINGEYWGQYEITEKISDYYIQSHYGVDADSVCIIKNNELEAGKEGSYNEWQDLYAWIMETNFSDDEKYVELCRNIDIKSYIDYISSEIYLCNSDWGGNNIAWWKAENIDNNNPYADGRWRFIVFDTDSSTALSKQSRDSVDSFSRLLSQSNFLSDIFRKLIVNNKFQCDFCNIFMDVANHNFNNEKVQTIINENAVEYETYILDFFKRFYCKKIFTPEFFQDQVNIVRDFYDTRFDYITSYMKNDLELSGNLVSINIDNNDTNGSVHLNTLNLSMDEDGTWSGKYYTDYPVHITAEPKAGKVFLYYDVTNDDGTTRIYEADTDIALTSDTIVKAVYMDEEDIDVKGMPYKVGADGRTYDVSVPHIVINSAYGAGAPNKKGVRSGYLSNDYIELYNPTDEDVDLSEWALYYRSSEAGGGSGEWNRHDLTGIIPAHCSYLVTCATVDKADDTTIPMIEIEGDESWEQQIYNKGFTVLLAKSQQDIPAAAEIYDNDNKCPIIYGYVDMYSVSGNDETDDQKALLSEGGSSFVQSKKKTVRRVNFTDTDDNTVDGDFKTIDYSFVDERYISYITPRNTSYGEWDSTTDTVPQYKVVYSTGNGSNIAAEIYDVYERISEPEEPVCEGCTFDGWYADRTYETLYDFSARPVSNTTIYAKWNINEYELTYEYNDGTEPEKDIYVYGSVIEQPENLEREGYTFAGWYSDEALETLYEFATMPAEDITLYAKWDINSYTIRFVTNGGSTVAAMTADYGSELTEPDEPVRDGYTFTGWFADKGLTKEYDFTKKPVSDVTLYAGWKVNNYTIRFESNGGEEIQSITKGYGDRVTEPLEPKFLGGGTPLPDGTMMKLWKRHTNSLPCQQRI
ncbi:MAG: InlB B-repeat-containing protein [Lachnospiraceae bacterium]|nr:InlB B-repeat-containing protein [Lachnospiraceae bacterium]